MSAIDTFCHLKLLYYSYQNIGVFMKVLSPAYFIIQGEPLYEDFDDYEYLQEMWQLKHIEESPEVFDEISDTDEDENL